MKFFIQLFITLILLSILWICIVFLQASNLTKTSQWVYDAYQKKIQTAKKIKTKKIVIVAGSNTLFGCNSKMLSKAFNLPIVNFGVNAGVLLPYTLYKAKEVINKGDIVLMPLEYSMYVYDAKPNEQMIDIIFSRDFDAFWHLSLKEMFYMVWNITFDRLYRGYKAQGGEKITKGLYGAHHIDNYGDQIKTDKKYQTKGMKNDIENNFAKHPEHYGAEYKQDAISWKYLKKFALWCKNNDVKLILMPATLLNDKTYITDKKERWFYTHLKDILKKQELTYIGNPYNYMYNKENYFNTNYHLINKARDVRTKQMIDDLKNILIK